MNLWRDFNLFNNYASKKESQSSTQEESKEEPKGAQAPKTGEDVAAPKGSQGP